MTPELMSTASHALAFGGALAVFTEETQRSLYLMLKRRAAMASGIEALAMRAIDTGDMDGLDMIATLASLQAEELLNLAAAVGQLKTMQPTPTSARV
jgi:hypothetical protein